MYHDPTKERMFTVRWRGVFHQLARALGDKMIESTTLLRSPTTRSCHALRYRQYRRALDQPPAAILYVGLRLWTLRVRSMLT